jgi:hypothetical protein
MTNVEHCDRQETCMQVGLLLGGTLIPGESNTTELSSCVSDRLQIWFQHGSISTRNKCTLTIASLSTELK